LNLGNGAGKHELRGIGSDPAIVIPNHVFHRLLPRGALTSRFRLCRRWDEAGSVITSRLRRAGRESGASANPGCNPFHTIRASIRPTVKIDGLSHSGGYGLPLNLR
jgi:hypothetical protein